MNARLAQFLDKNRARIVEAWEAEIEMPAPHAAMTYGGVPYDYLEELFGRIVGFLQYQNSAKADKTLFHSFMDSTFTCTPGNAACIELHRAGRKIFAEALKNATKTSSDFSRSEIEVFRRYLDNTLAVLLYEETEQCAGIYPKPFCPFTANSRAASCHFFGHSHKTMEPLSERTPS